MAKVAIVMTDLFEDVEYTSPREAMDNAGHQTVLIGPDKGTTVKGKQGNVEAEIEVGIDDAKPEDYDALFIPGGFSPDSLRADDRFLDFVRHFDRERKDIYTICHGPQLLVNADVLKGKDSTAVAQVGVDVTNAGGNYIDQAVVIDESGLISSRTPDDLPEFNEAIVKALNK